MVGFNFLNSPFPLPEILTFLSSFNTKVEDKSFLTSMYTITHHYRQHRIYLVSNRHYRTLIDNMIVALASADIARQSATIETESW